MRHVKTVQRVGEEAADQAREAASVSREPSAGGRAAALVSIAALIFSAVSLYESVLKRADLSIYVPPVVHYARNPGADVEKVIVPITISNAGARDGAVLFFSLVGKNAAGESKEFYSAYFVENDYFAKGEGFDPTTRRFKRNNRPKLPFAPISVAGRSSYSGTVLFHVRGKSFPMLVAEKGNYQFTLKAQTVTAGSSWFDRLLEKVEPKKIQPISFEVKLPYFSRQSLSAGSIVPLKSVKWSAPKVVPDNAPQDAKAPDGGAPDQAPDKAAPAPVPAATPPGGLVSTQ